MYTPITFPKMAEKLPVGSLGIARVEHFTVSDEDSKFTSIRAMLNRDEYVPAGTYARLFVDQTLMMSDTSMEQRSNYRVVREARGHVFIAGLGLGMILHPILEKPEVTKVTVIEKYADVIKLVGPTLPHRDKVELIEADVLTWKPTKGTKYDTIYFDIWPNITTDNLEDMALLHRRFAHFKAPGAWMDSWKRDLLLHQRKAQKRRGGWW